MKIKRDITQLHELSEQPTYIEWTSFHNGNNKHTNEIQYMQYLSYIVLLTVNTFC